ncbi:DUF2382 domain-containing protein [Streptomyces sp. NPDC018031]|uniref:DUF2382 domain-containing protein n=1 Tax=Streptomyces sp. NPDC018031 TaxID=3365033 RepID=UPI0037BAB928
MITKEQIPAVLDHPVYDTEGTKIGDAKHVFLDDVTGKPDWVSVRTGLFGMNESFVPVQDARLVQDHLEVPFTKSKVKDAPHVDVDSGGHLSVDEERKLYRHYDMDWSEGGRRTGPADTTGTGAAGAAGRGDRGRMGEPYPGAGMGTRGTAEGTGKGMDTGTRSAMTADEGRAADLGTGAGRPTAGRRRGRADLEAEQSMTRSEEELHIGVEQTEAGRARLHRYVETEHVERTVPLRHEELLIEREEITDANRGSVTGAQKLSESDQEIVLHRERAVVRTEVVPKERVRLRVEEHTTEETVAGDVRRERIDIETDETPPGTRGGGGRRGRARGTEYGKDTGEPGMDYGRGDRPGR